MTEIVNSQVRDLVLYIKGEMIETIRQFSSHTHNWEISGIDHPQLRGPVNPRAAGQATETIVLLRCSECNWVQTTILEGLWTLSQLMKGQASGSNKNAD
jgi:hypothetical protein